MLFEGDPLEAVAAIEPVSARVAADEGRLDGIARAFAQVIDAKSPFTYEHSARVAAIARAMAERLGWSAGEQRELWRAALMHDIGKLAVSNAILDKPGELTADEFARVREHPRFTFEILRRTPGFDDVALDASLHHERLDGRGYYRGWAGDRLTPRARMLAVADVMDALSADRPYRAALDRATVASMLRADAGISLCAEAVDAALQLGEHERLGLPGPSVLKRTA